ncbi:MAG: hypothetical protein U0Q22_18650 [Acidimicrobiales bacterium]
MTDATVSRIRRSRHTGVAALLGLGSLLLAACVPQPPVQRLDVDNPPVEVIGGLVTSNHWRQVQTFTAGRSGLLNEVHVFVQFTGPGELGVELYDVTGAHDLGALVGSGTHTGLTTGEVAVPLTQRAHVVAGHRYALALRGTVDEHQGSWQLSFNSTSPLPGETYFVHHDDGQDVYPGAAASISFRTFVLTPC